MIMQNMQAGKPMSKKPQQRVMANSNRGNLTSMGMTSDFQNHDNFTAKIPSKTTRRQIGFNQRSVNNTQLNFY